MSDAIDSLPWRGPNGERPDLPTPPGKLPLRRDGRWRKRWRYVGAFADEVMVCAARVHVGPAGAELLGRLRPPERRDVGADAHAPARRARRRLDRAPGRRGGRGRAGRPRRSRLRARRGVARAYRLGRSRSRRLPRVPSLSGAGDGPSPSAPPTRRASTSGRESAPTSPVEIDVRVGDRRWKVEARGMEDESAGYHPKHTVWSWSAGRRPHDRRPLGRLEPRRGHQRPAGAIRAGDLARRRAVRARPRRLRRPRRDRLRRRLAPRVHQGVRARQG